VDIETDKVVIEVVSPTDGILEEVVKVSGETIISDEVIGRLSEGPSGTVKDSNIKQAVEQKVANNPTIAEPLLSPAAKKLAEENKINPDSIVGSGKDGRVTKEDVLSYLSSGRTSSSAEVKQKLMEPVSDRLEERVPMSRLRSTVAKRMLQASQTTAMLTTFNEVNMAPIMNIRKRYKDEFEARHDGVRLGFMSFFVRASTEALKRFPAVNASLDGDDMVYHGYQDISVAIGSPRGLVAPVLRNTDHMGLAQIEKQIRDFGEKAKEGKLSIDEISGGTFTISNGGVFGSLLSTPIVNPPQTAVLGMHTIQERAVVVNGEITACPMMYLALSYDHQMIDGKEAVQFLIAIKELLEDPTRLLLEI
jgi:2-oxoglutarate dehydrogenase E2 component (dihydrolipoamide succinyltransferase)